MTKLSGLEMSAFFLPTVKSGLPEMVVNCGNYVIWIS